MEKKKAIDALNPFFCQNLYDLAEEAGKLRTFSCSGRSITYALLEEYNWCMEEVKEEFDLLVSCGARAFGFEHSSLGFCVFVIPQNVPEKFRDYVVLHEFEEITKFAIRQIQSAPSQYSALEADEWKRRQEANARQYAHREACDLELEAVFNQGMFFANSYARWLIERQFKGLDFYFENALPDFWTVDRRKRAKNSPLNAVINFYLFLWTENGRFLRYQHDRRLKMLESWPWMSKYL